MVIILRTEILLVIPNQPENLFYKELKEEQLYSLFAGAKPVKVVLIEKTELERLQDEIESLWEEKAGEDI